MINELHMFFTHNVSDHVARIIPIFYLHWHTQ